MCLGRWTRYLMRFQTVECLESRSCRLLYINAQRRSRTRVAWLRTRWRRLQQRTCRARRRSAAPALACTRLRSAIVAIYDILLFAFFAADFGKAAYSHPQFHNSHAAETSDSLLRVSACAKRDGLIGEARARAAARIADSLRVCAGRRPAASVDTATMALRNRVQASAG